MFTDSLPCMRVRPQPEDGSPPAPRQQWAEQWVPLPLLPLLPLQELLLLLELGTASIDWSRIKLRVGGNVPGAAEDPLAVTVTFHHQKKAAQRQVQQRLWRRRMG